MVVGGAYVLGVSTRDAMGFHSFLTGKASTGVLISDFSGVGRLDAHLLPESHQMLTSPNAGGNSVLSEALSCDIFQRAFGASGTRGELDIKYPYSGWYPCDMMMWFPRVEPDSSTPTNVCISVTRAMNYRDPGLFDYNTAYTLLSRKVQALNNAQRAVVETTDRFDHSILHVWCQTRRIADVVVNAWSDLGSLSAGTFLVCTVASRNPQIFTNYMELAPTESALRDSELSHSSIDSGHTHLVEMARPCI